MAKGGRRSTTWLAGWKSGKTAVVRVPEVLAEEILRIAREMDEGTLPVTGNQNSHVTGNKAQEEETLRESADAFLITIPPRDRREAKRWIDRFLKSLEV